jgi:hypothetical protein
MADGDERLGLQIIHRFPTKRFAICHSLIAHPHSPLPLEP